MNFFQRAIKNTFRRKTKTLLLLITFFVIGNFVIIGLGVSTAAESAKTLTRQKMRAVVTYTVDYDAIYRYMNELEDEDAINEFYKNYPRVTMADVEGILKDERVKTANAIASGQFYEAEGGVEHVRLDNDRENQERSRRPSGLRKTNQMINSLAHRTTWLRSDFSQCDRFRSVL